MKISSDFLVLTFGQLNLPFPHLRRRVERLLKIRAAYLLSTLSTDAAFASAAAEAVVAEGDDDDDEAEAGGGGGSNCPCHN